MPPINKCAGRDYIRLLTLLPDSDSTRAPRVTLAVVPLLDCPPYEALSYYWGGSSRDREISCNERAFWVTDSLYAALTRLRQRDAERTLWIDAICMNQNNVEERAYQVRLMDQIYRNAERVVMWLGETAQDSDAIFPLCRRLVEQRVELLQDGPMLSPDFIWSANRDAQMREFLAKRQKLKDHGEDATSEETVAFLDFLSRPYFSRCWVMQEIVLAREATIICGGESLDWDSFYLGFVLAVCLSGMGMTGRPRAQLRSPINYMLMRQKIAGREDLGSVIDINWLLRLTLALEATDPRDKVYSILSLISPAERNNFSIMPDYTISVEDCYKRAALSIMSRQKSLDVLFAERPHTTTLKLPSWAPDWKQLQVQGPISLARDYRDNQGDAPYNATRLSQCMPRLKGPGSDTLILQGYSVDRVIQLTSVMLVPEVDYRSVAFGKAPLKGIFNLAVGLLPKLGSYLRTWSECEDLAYSPRFPACPTGEDTDTAFAVTMCCGNIGGDAAKARKGWLEFREILKHVKKNPLLKNVGGPMMNSIISIVATLGRRGQPMDRVFATNTETSLYRRLARTEKGFLAIVPRSTAVGDEVMLLAGGNTPFVLRTKNSWRKSQQCCQIMGPCYVHGIMDGSAWDPTKVHDIAVD